MWVMFLSVFLCFRFVGFGCCPSPAAEGGREESHARFGGAAKGRPLEGEPGEFRSNRLALGAVHRLLPRGHVRGLAHHCYRCTHGLTSEVLVPPSASSSPVTPRPPLAAFMHDTMATSTVTYLPLSVRPSVSLRAQTQECVEIPAGSAVGDDHGGGPRVRDGTVRGTPGRRRVRERVMGVLGGTLVVGCIP